MRGLAGHGEDYALTQREMEPLQGTSGEAMILRRRREKLPPRALPICSALVQALAHSFYLHNKLRKQVLLWTTVPGSVLCF